MLRIFFIFYILSFFSLIFYKSVKPMDILRFNYSFVNLFLCFSKQKERNIFRSLSVCSKTFRHPPEILLYIFSRRGLRIFPRLVFPAAVIFRASPPRACAGAGSALKVALEGASAAADAVGNAAGTAVNTAKDAAGAAVDTAKETAGAAKDAIGGAVDSVKNLFK